MKVFTSPFRNPFINLALEDYFLRERSDLPLLFFYVNRPCVVLGRFQNPWLESRLPYLTENDIWLVRRQSGGGCVYHDEGNLNFSFIVPGPVIDRSTHAQLLSRAFEKSAVELSISPRNDLWLKDSQGEWKKISGSAYKQTRDASFHHGTFLVSSDLNVLENCLQHTLVPKESKSIASVRSKVISLQQRFPQMSIQDVIELVCCELGTAPVELDGTYLSLTGVQESFERLRSWDWLWGETPLFEIESLRGPVKVHKGRFQESREVFSRSSAVELFTKDNLEMMFPDFSEQRRSSSRIL
ncbi:MAG TPA: biotin/lipoate A/B protein ligase family protein [Bacteriovoracaceae bacterium]|nr:biotin/lipoate A/B protein ligase family protein [Bacteriovoracaceae bacterium]